MTHDSFVFTVFLIFTGAAFLATVALFARQALLIAYILLGALLGPSGLGLVQDSQLVSDISDIGIMFLLFLLGLDMQPQELLRLVRKTTVITLLSSAVFGGLGFVIAWLFGFSLLEAAVVACAMTFSSTIIGLKLLPTTVLHHQRTGEIIVSILLLQDLLAIVVLLFLQGAGGSGEPEPWREILRPVLALPLLIVLTWAFERIVLIRLLRRFDKIREYLFLMTIGWCLGVAELANALGLSHEMGAFIAGVVLAANPVALYIAESLRPLRDFFLVLFFVSLGAGFDLGMMGGVLLPALLIAALMLLIKPLVFGYLLQRWGETEERSREVGFRLGQLSEFSLLIAVLAQEMAVIGERASLLIQLATVLTFLASTYIVVLRFYTPIAISDRLRRD